jgi:DNA-binding response OmpR family regulator
MNGRILIVEDDPDIAESLRYNLKREGYKAEIAESGEKGYRLAVDTRQPPSLIVLDLMLPGMSGADLCQRLRRDPATEKTPIIILTAKASEADKIAGLEIGADDYMTKPFSVKELMARIRAVMRRAAEESPSADRYEDAKLVIEPEEMRVSCCGENLKLTRKEFSLLSLLAKNLNKVSTRQKLLDDVWGYDYYGDGRTLDVHIRRLRQKLGDCAESIETVAGIGYRFVGNK